MHLYELLYVIDEQKLRAPGEDRTHDLQIALCEIDYETDALPTALPRPRLRNI